MTKKTSTPRVLKGRDKAKTLDRKRKEYSITDEEHGLLRGVLSLARKQGGASIVEVYVRRKRK